MTKLKSQLFSICVIIIGNDIAVGTKITVIRIRKTYKCWTFRKFAI